MKELWALVKQAQPKKSAWPLRRALVREASKRYADAVRFCDQEGLPYEAIRVRVWGGDRGAEISTILAFDGKTWSAVRGPITRDESLQREKLEVLVLVDEFFQEKAEALGGKQANGGWVIPVPVFYPCECFRPGVDGWTGAMFERRALQGEDRRCGKADLLSCRRCRQKWLWYRYDDSQYSCTEKCFRGVLTAREAAEASVERAAALLAGMAWYWEGGSYYDGKTFRSAGRLDRW